ncbi:MAG: LUD domain-containing protein [Patescibacteria group bacterium]|nr:LUD domain-containing protein [Patescibacteria group bacterium]
MRAFDQLADEATTQKTIIALQHNGIAALVMEDGAAAKQKVLELIPAGAEVMNMTSVTLDAIGLAAELTSDRFRSVRKQLEGMDRKIQGAQMQKLGAAPEWAVGSVHAVTEDGQVLIASNTGSQLPAYAYGAAHVIWVVGTQKIVADNAAGLRRIHEYCLPLESERAKIAYHTQGSAVRKVLTISQEIRPGRITLILVGERLGF